MADRLEGTVHRKLAIRYTELGIEIFYSKI